MYHSSFIEVRRVLAGLALAASVAGCGGGAASTPFDGPVSEPNSAVSPLMPNTAPASSTSTAPYLVDAENLMDSFEVQDPTYFPDHSSTVLSGSYAYRHYPGTGNYIGVRGDIVMVKGPGFGSKPVQLAHLPEFACTVFPEECTSANGRPITKYTNLPPASDPTLGALGSDVVDAVRAAFPDRAPTAVASGPSAVTAGSVVTLDGSLSSDPDGDLLTYSWTLTRPTLSTSIISNASSSRATFTPDRGGSYVATLTVSDGKKTASASVNVTAAALDNAPTALAFGPSSTTTGSIVYLDGSLSSDPDGDTLSFQWTLTGPALSHSFVSNSNSSFATFIPDLVGNYVATLTVSDGQRSSSSSVYVSVTSSSSYCCKYCSTGKPCGDTCISRSYTCHSGPGCAC